MAMRARSDNAKSSSDERMEGRQMALLLFFWLSGDIRLVSADWYSLLE